MELGFAESAAEQIPGWIRDRLEGGLGVDKIQNHLEVIRVAIPEQINHDFHRQACIPRPCIVVYPSRQC